jgi:hypothetical protein
MVNNRWRIAIHVPLRNYVDMEELRGYGYQVIGDSISYFRTGIGIYVRIPDGT